MATKNNRKKASPAKVCRQEAPRNVQPVAPATPGATSTAVTAREEEVVVVYGPEVEAQKVSVAGDFNGWNPDAHPLERISATTYAATWKLPPGEYQYKFVVDGTWVEDPNAPRHVPNVHGSRNSVLLV